MKTRNTGHRPLTVTIPSHLVEAFANWCASQQFHLHPRQEESARFEGVTTDVEHAIRTQLVDEIHHRVVYRRETLSYAMWDLFREHGFTYPTNFEEHNDA